MGFEGWRHSRQLQDELLETLEAGLGADMGPIWWHGEPKVLLCFPWPQAAEGTARFEGDVVVSGRSNLQFQSATPSL